MTRKMALVALTALGLPGGPVHEPVHDPPQRALRSVTMCRASSAVRTADNGGAPSSLRAQSRFVCRVMGVGAGFGQDYRTCRIAGVACAPTYAQVCITFHDSAPRAYVARQLLCNLFM
jgi:hypothetical protein